MIWSSISWGGNGFQVIAAVIAGVLSLSSKNAVVSNRGQLMGFTLATIGEGGIVATRKPG